MGLDKDAISKALGATPSDHEWASDCGLFGPVKLVCNKCGLMKSPGEKDGVTCHDMRSGEHYDEGGRTFCPKHKQWGMPISAGNGSGYGRGAVECMFCGAGLD